MPRPLTVTAIIATYNEEDVIGVVLADLMDQGVRVHLLDQASTDGTLAEAERFKSRGRLDIERLEGSDFSLARIVRRKEALAAELATDWVVNADADEFRESPWPASASSAASRRSTASGSTPSTSPSTTSCP
jgi:glycosyltransferase involved in cell wall biosynthesis